MMTRSKFQEQKQIIIKNKHKILNFKVLNVMWIMSKYSLEDDSDILVDCHDYLKTKVVPINKTKVKLGSNNLLIAYECLENGQFVIVHQCIDNIITVLEKRLDNSKDVNLQFMAKNWHTNAVMFINNQCFYYTLEKI